MVPQGQNLGPIPMRNDQICEIFPKFQVQDII